MTKKPCVEAAAPSPCSEISRSAPTRAPNRPRAPTHGPQSSRLLVVRVSRTVAPSASSRRASARDTRQVKVASGKPPLVAVPVVLHGFHSPTQTSRLICAGAGCCRAGGPGRGRSSDPQRRPATGPASPRLGPAGARRASERAGTATSRRGERRRPHHVSLPAPRVAGQWTACQGLYSRHVRRHPSPARTRPRSRSRSSTGQGLRLGGRLAGLVPERRGRPRGGRLEALADYAGRYAASPGRAGAVQAAADRRRRRDRRGATRPPTSGRPHRRVADRGA